MTECGRDTPNTIAHSHPVTMFQRSGFRNTTEAVEAGWCQVCMDVAGHHQDPVEFWTRRLQQRTQWARDEGAQQVVSRVAAEMDAIELFVNQSGQMYEELVAALLGVDSPDEEVPGRVEVHRNTRAELHCETGPAWSWIGGYKVYALEGIMLPAWVIEAPNPARFLEELTNAEQRRVAFGLYGWERAAAEMGWTVIDDSGDPEVGVLYRLPPGTIMDSTGRFSLNLLYVRNSSPHPGGHHQYYGLMVPQRHETAADAQAALWGITTDEWRGLQAQT